MAQQLLFRDAEDDSRIVDEWFAPLAAFAAVVSGITRYRWLDAADFLFAGVAQRERTRILTFRHAHTHGCLHLDDHGHLYRYFPPKPGSGRAGRYHRQTSLAAAMEQVRLWELPWLWGSGLDAHRHGLDADDSELFAPTSRVQDALWALEWRVEYGDEPASAAVRHLFGQVEAVAASAPDTPMCDVEWEPL